MLDRFSKAKVLVIGDVMLDRYWWGRAERISPEAPVPVVLLEKTANLAGGAANVALNVVGLGAKAFLIGVIGDDEEGRQLCSILEDRSISSEFLIKDGRTTTVKTRIVAHNQHVVRIDKENTEQIGEEQERKVLKLFSEILEEADVVILSDYAKGLFGKEFTRRLITLSREKNKRIFVDPKGKDFSKYKHATSITPNQKEALEASGTGNVEEAGNILLHNLETDCVLVTQGEKGMTLFLNDGSKKHFPTITRSVYDVTGAGDTVIATFAVGIACGLSHEESAKLANTAAGIVVEEIGTSTINIEKLTQRIGNHFFLQQPQ